MENRREGEEKRELVFPIHSQVRKIKQEDEKIKDPEPSPPQQPDTRRAVLREITRQLSRSPLGRVISVCEM
ncbi:uncharacterized protein LOC131251552 [Magnolia sinica]|uniref:uncharacterized protein LOC131251552 n=1 Tax=Magnolia sinica TaxID=86752 RepID=UPI0026593ADF|nr:uncharacterized protein LOC131251552 [Magnolia sinica]